MKLVQKVIALAGFLSLSLVQASPPKIAFDVTPEHGMPKEAADQERGDNKAAGALAEILDDSLTTVRVRYFSKTWKSQEEVGNYLSGLLVDKETQAWTRQPWSQGVGIPEIECLLTFKDHSEGRLLLWQTVGCLRDGKGRWWFITPQAYFHRKHPQGDRTWKSLPGTGK